MPSLHTCVVVIILTIKAEALFKQTEIVVHLHVEYSLIVSCCSTIVAIRVVDWDGALLARAGRVLLLFQGFAQGSNFIVQRLHFKAQGLNRIGTGEGAVGVVIQRRGALRRLGRRLGRRRDTRRDTRRDLTA